MIGQTKSCPLAIVIIGLGFVASCADKPQSCRQEENFIREKFRHLTGHGDSEFSFTVDEFREGARRIYHLKGKEDSDLEYSFGVDLGTCEVIFFQKIEDVV